MSTTVLEEMNVDYHQDGDYVLPNLKVDDEKEYYIGVWGQRYRQHLHLLQLFDERNTI